MCDSLVEMRKDIAGQSRSANGGIRIGCIVDEVERERICKGAKLEELLSGDIVIDSGVVNISHVEIIEDVVGVIESNCAVGEVPLQDRLERIVERLCCCEKTKVV